MRQSESNIEHHLQFSQYALNAGSEDTHCQVECKLKGALGFKCPFQSHTQMQTVHLAAKHLHSNCFRKCRLGRHLNHYWSLRKKLRSKGINDAKLIRKRRLLSYYPSNRFLGHYLTNASCKQFADPSTYNYTPVLILLPQHAHCM